MITEPSLDALPNLAPAARTAGQRVITRLVTDLEVIFRRIVAHQARRMNVDADDLYQEAVMRILKQSRVNPDHDALSGWLGRCVVFAAADLKRRDGYDTPWAEIPDSIAVDASPEQLILRRELVERTGDLLRTLPPRQREILIMRIVHGLSANETADAVGTTPQAVRVAQHRALNRLRRTMQSRTTYDRSNQHSHDCSAEANWRCPARWSRVVGVDGPAERLSIMPKSYPVEFRARAVALVRAGNRCGSSRRSWVRAVILRMAREKANSA